jgi:sulfonate transport system permease protein
MLRRVTGPALVVFAWQAASSTGLIDRQTLAPPADVAATAWRLTASGQLPADLLVSLQRVLIGGAAGVSMGLALAVLAGLFRWGDGLVDSTMQMFRTVPVLALVPLMILWLGIGETPKLALIAIGTTFPVYINTYAAIRGVDVRLVEAARSCGLSRPELVRHVILPGALPGFLVGLRYSLGVGWLVLIVSEQINATSGLGYLMNQAREFFQTDVIVVGLVTYALLGLLSDALVRGLERSLLSWRREFAGA